MRAFLGMFVSTSNIEVSSLVTEPIAMLLWGSTLLALCSVLRRFSRRADAQPVSEGPERETAMDGVPSFAARS